MQMPESDAVSSAIPMLFMKLVPSVSRYKNNMRHELIVIIGHMNEKLTSHCSLVYSRISWWVTEYECRRFEL